jgi:Zn-dependent protease with chaperone function
MDFFESQDRARRKSGLLVLYFVIAVVLMIASLYAAAVAVFGFTIRGQVEAEPIHWFQPVILLTVTGITLAIIGLGSLYKIAELRSGGESVAAMLGGRRISTNTDDLAERQLLNVVEEMALASGVAVPAVYVMDNEPGINAFAAGFTPDDAVVSVNRGTLEYLTRDELQGVIAHEFSHILNGDMRFNIRLIGLLHGILLLGIIGYYLMRFSGTSGRSNRSGKGGGQLVLLGLAAFVIGYVGLFFGRLIKAAVTRQREYLADASAVQFTRNPDGIGGALKKIGGLAAGSYMDTPEAESASHMFFGSGFRRMSFSIFATHPPLDERIRRIDPRFDGRFPQVQPVRIGREPAPPPRPPKTGFPRPFKTPMGERLPLDPAVLLGAIGAPTSEHVAYSAQLIESLPGPIQVAVRDPFGAR